MPKSNFSKALLIAVACIAASSGGQLAAMGKKPDPEQAQSTHWVVVSATPVLLNPDDEDDDQIGALVYRGGVELSSSDPRFTELSGLIISQNGKSFLSVSDGGHWISGSLKYHDGTLTDVDSVEVAPILGPDGFSLVGTTWADAESLIGDLKGRVLVSFEGKHRVWAYDFGTQGFNARPSPFPMPHAVSEAPPNKGLEGIAMLKSGTETLIAMTENALNDEGNLRGWIQTPDGSTEVSLLTNQPYNPTDLAVLPDGDLLVLERRFSVLGGVGMALRRIDGSTLQSASVLEGDVLAEIAPPHTIDNMEGLAVRRTEDGRTLIYIVSDDNDNPLQRTLLMMFELEEESVD